MPSTPSRTTPKWLALGLLLASGPAFAQELPPANPPPRSAISQGLFFQKEPSHSSSAAPARPTLLPKLLFTKEPGAVPNLTSNAVFGDLGSTPGAIPTGTGDSERSVVQAQRMDGTPATTDDSQEYHIQLDPPGPSRLFKLESQQTLQERMRQEARQRSSLERIQFPEEPIISKERYAGRHWLPTNKLVAPAYVCHGPLLFEERNAERQGWDLGIFQPFLSTGVFYYDVVTVPYHAALKIGNWYDCSAGKCLPGDPVPYLLYPPEFRLSATAAEAGTLLALFAVFP